MPRIRSLKYEYFINEDLAQTSAEARLLGLGLTTVADREGRLEDRPARIKVVLFPYHDVDVDALLGELQTAGFLQRYSIENKRYICIVNFLKHQKPHPREVASVIPSREKVSPRRTKVLPGREKESRPGDLGKPSSVVNGSGNGLGDLGSLGEGNGSGNSANAGASAAQPRNGDATDFTIWKLGVGKLMSAGMPEQEARSFLGGKAKEHGKDALAAAITKTLAQEPADPKSYLVAVLQSRGSPRIGTSKVDASLAAVRRVVQEYESDEH